jgi:hypothetical protein
MIDRNNDLNIEDAPSGFEHDVVPDTSHLDLRDSILGADDIETERIFVRQWGVEVEVKGMSGTERSHFVARLSASDAEGEDEIAKVLDDTYADIIIQTVHDPNSGKRLFRRTDRGALQGKSGAALEFVARKAMDLAGLSESSMEEMRGKSEKAVK